MHAGIKFIELGKQLGERWRALTPTEKKRYEDMAAQDKIRFQREMEEYTAKQAEAAAAAAAAAQMPGAPHHVPSLAGQVAPPPDPTLYYAQHDPSQVVSGYPAPAVYGAHDPYSHAAYASGAMH